MRRSRQPLIRAAPDSAEALGCFCAKHIKDRANKLETKTNQLTERSVVEQTLQRWVAHLSYLFLLHKHARRDSDCRRRALKSFEFSLKMKCLHLDFS